MSRTIVFILLSMAVQLANCEEVKCQITTVETAEGLMGYCCFLPKATFKQLFSSNTKNVHLPPLPIMRGMQDMMNPHRPAYMHYPDYPKEPTDNYQSRLTEKSRTIIEKPPIPHLLNPNSTVQEESDPTIPSNGNVGDIQTFGIFEYPFTGSKVPIDGTKNEENNASSNDITTIEPDVTTIYLNNRNNINAPKTCSGGYYKTKQGDCKPAFG